MQGNIAEATMIESDRSDSETGRVVIRRAVKTQRDIPTPIMWTTADNSAFIQTTANARRTFVTDI